MHTVILLWIKQTLPASTIVILMLFALLLSQTAPITASFLPLIGLHFWLLPQPMMLPLWLVLLLALLQDAIAATSFGSHPLVWVAFYASTISSSAIVQQSAIIAKTIHYAFSSLLVPLILFALAISLGQGAAIIGELMLGWAGACLLYPFVALLLRGLEIKMQ